MVDVLNLITTIQTVDEYGDPIVLEGRRQVFCSIKSIGTKEFYQAHASGLQPEIKFVLADYLEYNGEQLIDYDGTRYHVLRTYRTGNELEITCYTEVNP